MDEDEPPMLTPVDRPLNLVPVGLKEAALDSPTFRATALHFADQVELVEKWLDGYVRTGTKLTHDIATLEGTVNTWLQQIFPPTSISEAVLDHDYTLLATTRYGEAAREYWQGIFKDVKRSEQNIIDPIRNFVNTDLRSFKEARRAVEQAQRSYDVVLARYAAQPKTKEASSLREDAFQLHEARKAYMKTSMDFCVQGPAIRASLDKLLVKVFTDQWRESRNYREANAAMFSNWGAEMDRIRGWGRELENSERAFKRELQIARKQIEESAENVFRPPRELEDYAEKTAPYLGSSTPSKQRPEKQGWLHLKSITGKPARTIWSRRWFFVKNGIFGWLMQGHRSGGVEESEKTGVLLCSTRPALQEERRFCFEVKTKDTSIVLQAETQNELSQWIEAFELAKRKALEDPSSTESPTLTSTADAAFAISPPVAPELAAKGDGHIGHGSEDQLGGLAPPDQTTAGQAARSSFDVSSTRKSTTLDREGETSRDPAARLMQKLDLHKRSVTNAQPSSAGGIASLIASSHNALPVGPTPATPIYPSSRSVTMPISSLTPSTLANPPAPTNLSKTAVAISGERGIGISQSSGSGMPSGIMANLWGSEKWGAVNRLEHDGKPSSRSASRSVSLQASPEMTSRDFRSTDDVGVMDGEGLPPKDFGGQIPPSPARMAHRKTVSVHNENLSQVTPWNEPDGFPNYYPLALKAQDAQFRILFPDVPRVEKVVLVFRATWNPNEQQEFPGRVYVTEREIYFYSHHLGFILITGVGLDTVTEITAAPGRDCDFLFVHLKDITRPNDLRRVTIKTFLEPLKLLQKRLNFLVKNANAENPLSLEEILKTMIKMESQGPKPSGEPESWDGFGEEDDDIRPRQHEHDVRPGLHIDNTLYGEVGRTGREVTRFRLPAQAVVYKPSGYGTPTAVKDFSTSAKALFHVAFGDRSAVFQTLYQNRTSDGVTQFPWTTGEDKHLKRTLTCSFNSTIFTDTQSIDVQNDHLCYVVTSNQGPVHLPMSNQFHLLTKFVITHSSKSQSRFAIFHKVVWTTNPSTTSRSRRLVELRAKRDLEHDAESLLQIAIDQVSKLGSHSATSKAMQIFGGIGQSTVPLQISVPDLPSSSTISRRKLRTWTLIALYRHEALKQVFKLVTIVFDILIAVAKSIMNAASAHTLLVALLIVSALYNSWHGYRDGLVWYQDRSAAKFMARLGVGGRPEVSRAIRLMDVDELVGVPTGGNWTEMVRGDEGVSSCRTTFGDVLSLGSEDGADVGIANAAGRAAGRLHRTRERLARYRHDLLVAMRVVNRVEEEVVVAEWEDWVREESKKCVKMTKLLKGSSEDGKGKKSGDGGELGRELESYCMSCKKELDALRS